MDPDQIDDGITRMKDCMRFIKSWMSQHQLKMNDSKTEYLIISSSRITQQITAPTLDVGVHVMKPSGQEYRCDYGFGNDNGSACEQYLQTRFLAAAPYSKNQEIRGQGFTGMHHQCIHDVSPRLL